MSNDKSHNRYRVSVIIPVYNGEKYLGEAIESVLTQTFVPAELIVMDDGSTDGTPAVTASFGQRVRYISQPHQNGIVARNNAIHAASGNMIAFLDADDLWTNDKLELQIQAFNQEPSLDAVFCMLQNFISPDLTPEETAKYYCPPDPMPGYLLQTILFKRELFAALGPLDTSLEIAGPVEWCQRLLNSQHRRKLLEFVGVQRRIHASNQTHTHKVQANKEYLRMAKLALDKKRSQKK